jgi:two-component system, OmpR family, KDP operon response regulator KdpE
MTRVLIIEDNPDFVDFVQAVLELNGYTVAHTASLHAGIRLSNEMPHDLVLLDLDLPDGNGLNFFDQVPADMPVLVMTASTDADLARHLQALGARYVIKPLAARDLLDLVNTSLKKGAAHDSPADSHRR